MVRLVEGGRGLRRAGAHHPAQLAQKLEHPLARTGDRFAGVDVEPLADVVEPGVHQRGPAGRIGLVGPGGVGRGLGDLDQLGVGGARGGDEGGVHLPAAGAETAVVLVPVAQPVGQHRAGYRDHGAAQRRDQRPPLHPYSPCLPTVLAP
ncbi:hypothetical protein ACFQ0T_06505 [Kitasatospora gansuensis]